ncbi:hypothetical protein MBLNU230_g5904t1 [Neophaeotheca triangularis]
MVIRRNSTEDEGVELRYDNFWRFSPSNEPKGSGMTSHRRYSSNSTRPPSRTRRAHSPAHESLAPDLNDENGDAPQHPVEEEDNLSFSQRDSVIDFDKQREASDLKAGKSSTKEEEMPEEDAIAQIDGAVASREQDTEAGPLESQRQNAAKTERDPNLVTWDGPNDPENPRNWSMKRKWTATFLVGCFTFISPVASSMVAPALSTIAQEFNTSSELESSMVLSIFILAYTVGPLLFGPLSELCGRTMVLQGANAFFLVFNLACGFAQNSGQMNAFRFLSGIGGSAPLGIGGGTLGDC